MPSDKKEKKKRKKSPPTKASALRKELRAEKKKLASALRLCVRDLKSLGVGRKSKSA